MVCVPGSLGSEGVRIGLGLYVRVLSDEEQLEPVPSSASECTPFSPDDAAKAMGVRGITAKVGQVDKVR